MGRPKFQLKNKISEHLERVFYVFKHHPEWLTSKEVAMHAGILDSDARKLCFQLAEQGILGSELFSYPYARRAIHHYKLSEFAEKRNKIFLAQLNEAAIVYGPPILSTRRVFPKKTVDLSK
jgi:hypothetical protein